MSTIPKEDAYKIIQHYEFFIEDVDEAKLLCDFFGVKHVNDLNYPLFYNTDYEYKYAHMPEPKATPFIIQILKETLDNSNYTIVNVHNRLIGQFDVDTSSGTPVNGRPDALIVPKTINVENPEELRRNVRVSFEFKPPTSIGSFEQTILEVIGKAKIQSKPVLHVTTNLEEWCLFWFSKDHHLCRYSTSSTTVAVSIINKYLNEDPNLPKHFKPVFRGIQNQKSITFF